MPAYYSLSKFSLVLKRWSAPRRVTIDAVSGDVFVDGRLSVAREATTSVRLADGIFALGVNAKFRAAALGDIAEVEAFAAALVDAGWPTAPEPTAALRQISAAECSAHTARDDCWLIVHGNVYDVSPFVAAHPGGAAVLVHPRNAGVDVGAAFDSAGHSKRARKLLASYRIGVLAAGAASSDEDDIGTDASVRRGNAARRASTGTETKRARAGVRRATRGRAGKVIHCVDRWARQIRVGAIHRRPESVR